MSSPSEMFLKHVANVITGSINNDTIYTIKTDLEKSPKYPEMGLYRASYEIFKNDGELVLYCEHIQTVKYKSGERPG